VALMILEDTYDKMADPNMPAFITLRETHLDRKIGVITPPAVSE
jgi:hypothetical protein